MLGLCVAVLFGCLSIDKRFVHDPPLAHNVGKIEKGKTTKEDILQYFGIPDIEADGARIKIGPNHPALQSFRDAARQIAVTPTKVPDVPAAYSSIDEERLAFFYAETLAKGAIAIPGGGVVSVARNKLLIFINKRTGLVEEFSYREEFKPQ